MSVLDESSGTGCTSSGRGCGTCLITGGGGGDSDAGGGGDKDTRDGVGGSAPMTVVLGLDMGRS